MDYLTATPIVKKIIQAYDFKIFIYVRVKAVDLKNGTWLQPKGPVTLVRMNERVIRTSFQCIVVRITKFFLVSHC